MTALDATTRVIMVGHAHIDSVWLWDWREGYEVVKATLRSALDRTREFPGMVFVHGSAAHFAWLENHPALFAEVAQAVEDGRIGLVTGMWVEPDTNLPSGEALVRQTVQGQRYFREKFRRTARVGALPDTFGHPWTLPQILAGAGMDTFLFMRPGPHELELPAEVFWWTAPDGTRVLAHRLSDYNTGPGSVAGSLERNLARVPARCPAWLGFYGVGNHGGGPTRSLLESIVALAADPEGPRLELGAPEAFFAAVRDRPWPAVRGELQHHARGAYSACSAVKWLNRRAETDLVTAEKLAVFAGRSGFDWPGAELTRAWRSLLFTQFHDTLAGTAIAPAYDDAYREIGGALAAAGRIAHLATQRIADRVRTRRARVDEVIRHYDPGDGSVTDYGDGVPVLVFNPSPFTRTEGVRIEVNDWTSERMRVLDEADHEVLSQPVAPSAVIAAGRRGVLVEAQVPPCGYRLYRLAAEPPAPGKSLGPDLDGGVVQTDRLRVEIDPARGGVRSVRDLARGRELLRGPGATGQVLRDPGDTWGHGVAAYREVVGELGDGTLAVEERGPVRAVLALTTRYEASTLIQRVIVYRDLPVVIADCELDWRAPRHLLKLAFPLDVRADRVSCEIPYGRIEREATGEEEPGQRWIAVRGADGAGVALVNDGRYAFDCRDGVVRMTVARSAVYAHHDPRRLKPDERYRYQDTGLLRFRWALAAFDRDGEDEVMALAEAFQRPLDVVREYAHDGDLPPRYSFLTLDPPGAVELGALKQAEDGQGLIIRLREQHGRHVRVRLTMADHGIRQDLELTPYSIRSWRLHGGTAFPVDLLEGRLP